MASDEAINAMLTTVEERISSTLSPVERLLMATDGTITHMLSALTEGPVSVDILDRDVDTATLSREVVLRQEADATPLLWARSVIDLAPLPEKLASALVQGDTGIGDLLREEQVATRRVITGMDAVHRNDPACPAFIRTESAVYLERTYHVYAGSDRSITITEWLPKGLF